MNISNQLSNLEADYQKGIEILKKLSALSYKDLKKVINFITGNKLRFEHIFNEGHVRKYITNDVCTMISITCYDCILITSSGISYTPEHGKPEIILEFNEYINLTIPKL